MPLSVVVPGAKIWSIELSLFPFRSPKVTRIHKWDQEFESAFLQRRVRKLSVPSASPV
jgi:hypothetical protein